MLFFVADTFSIIRLKLMTITENFPWLLEYVHHDFLFKSHEKKSNGIWKRGFCAPSKLVYFKTQLLELIESSMEVGGAELL